MTTQSNRCKICAHILTQISEEIKKAYIQSFRTISENQCLLQILKVIMIGRRYIIKAFKDSNRYEHRRTDADFSQCTPERISPSPDVKSSGLYEWDVGLGTLIQKLRRSKRIYEESFSRPAGMNCGKVNPKSCILQEVPKQVKTMKIQLEYKFQDQENSQTNFKNF
ncbi:hypothetical protein Tco_0762500 [Tanacetum coccineum]